MATAKTLVSEIISVSDLAWQERQPGVRMKHLWEHPESRRRAVMTRIEPGATLPLHRHAGDELVFVIEGAIGDEFGTVTAGNVGYRPDGCVHTVSSTNGATVLAIITGGVEPATGRGDAPPSRIFNLTHFRQFDLCSSVVIAAESRICPRSDATAGQNVVVRMPGPSPRLFLYVKSTIGIIDPCSCASSVVAHPARFASTSRSSSPSASKARFGNG
jgi:quercetin dioxygenase-like cupin family protein